LHPSKEEAPAHERPYMFEWNTESTSSNDEDPGEDSLFRTEEEEDFKVGKSISEDQVINEEGLMEIRRTKERLEEQARKRREKLKATKKQEMTKEEFNEKWTLPAYLRRGVKMDNVPHSSEPFISRYNLNDDNNLLGNNKFLHDNVD
jgi:cell division protein FtsZ